MGGKGGEAGGMGGVANAFPDRSRATEARRNGSAGTEGHGTCRHGSAEAVSGIEREGGRRCCTHSKRICGSCRERTAGAASPVAVRAADCLLQSGQLVARALDRQEKRDGGSAGDGCIPLANRFAVADRELGAVRCGRISRFVGRPGVLERIGTAGAGTGRRWVRREWASVAIHRGKLHWCGNAIWLAAGPAGQQAATTKGEQ